MVDARLEVRVTPRASDDRIAGARDRVLLVRVTAAPDGGRANAAVCRVVADALGVPKSSVTVIRGHTARAKIIGVAGVDQERIDALVSGATVPREGES